MTTVTKTLVITMKATGRASGWTKAGQIKLDYKGNLGVYYAS